MAKKPQQHDTENAEAMRAEITRLTSQLVEESDLANRHRRAKGDLELQLHDAKERTKTLELENARLRKEADRLRKQLDHSAEPEA